MPEQGEMSKETFLGLVKLLGLPGTEERLDALYEDVRTLLQRAAPLYEIDTTGVEPSPINPWFEDVPLSGDNRGPGDSEGGAA